MLDLNTYLVKERVGLLKLVDTYDIFDPKSGEQIGIAREEPSGLVKVLRFLVNKKLLPTVIRVYAGDDDRPVFSIRRGMALLRPKIRILDADDNEIGHFRGKVLSLGGGFWVYDQDGNQFAEVKGDWKGWNFRFIAADGQELGTVTKKWAGLGKELFTSADNYVIALNPGVGEREGGNLLLLAAGLSIDMIFKEHG